MPLSELELSNLNNHFLKFSYIEGYTPSKTDALLYEQFPCGAPINYPNICRWYSHIASYLKEIQNFPGDTKNKIDIIIENQKVGKFF